MIGPTTWERYKSGLPARSAEEERRYAEYRACEQKTGASS